MTYQALRDEIHALRSTALSSVVGLGLLLGGPALAQYAPVDPVPSGQAATSVMANKISGDIAGGKGGANSVSGRCLADSGPGPERRTMEREYARKLKSGGKKTADAWRIEHGRAYRAQLVAAGKCLGTPQGR